MPQRLEALEEKQVTTPDDWPDHQIEEYVTKLSKTVAVDFDGVLHPYTAGWVGSTPSDEPPIEGAAAFLETLYRWDYRVVVFSTRADHPLGYEGITGWLGRYGLDRWVAEVTHVKPAAIAYVDDRAVPYLGDWAPVYEGIARLTDSRPHGTGNQLITDLILAHGMPPAVDDEQALKCVLCHFDPTHADSRPMPAVTICQGNATCQEHLPIVASGAAWAMIHNALTRRAIPVDD